ncbi:hypothetical protein [Pseudomonas sp. H3(2019)]|uniref:hypothetical protein n=1 Tax=Pseudomonas sp. H3(2019) TaxID=2598724 RepID=UPI0015B78834|nr:hypothetical protein [Pseudomonas sp. H3(2019)]
MSMRRIHVAGNAVMRPAQRRRRCFWRNALLRAPVILPRWRILYALALGAVVHIGALPRPSQGALS